MYILNLQRTAESLKAVRNQSNIVIKQIDYDSFGNILNDTNPTLSTTTPDRSLDDLNIPLAFAGGLYDKDTGLVRFGYRDYDPHTGRWTAKDPIDFNGGSSNLYTYVGNDPINYVDPEGENPIPFFRQCFKLFRRVDKIDDASKRLGDINLTCRKTYREFDSLPERFRDSANEKKCVNELFMNWGGAGTNPIK
jgi:RHS repeat-associated protein